MPVRIEQDAAPEPTQQEIVEEDMQEGNEAQQLEVVEIDQESQKELETKEAGEYIGNKSFLETEEVDGACKNDND